MKLKLIAALAACSLLLIAQERFDLKVRNYFFSGFTGDSEALQKGMKICEDALATDSKNAQAMVWHGSGLMFQSGQEFRKGDQEAGMRIWTRGLKEMDDAVALEPNTLGVRIPRGAALLATSRFVPPDAARPLIERGLSDYERAYELQADRFDGLGTHPRGELMIGIADSYSRLGNPEKAAQWFERIRTGLKGSAYEESANLWFETKSLPAAKAGCLGCHTGK